MKAASVSVPNLSGTFKRFRNLSAPGVEAWKASFDVVKTTRAKKVKVDPFKRDQELLAKGDRAIEAAFDGMDPVDILHPYLQQQDLTFDDLDRVYRKNHKMDFYSYLALMWQDTQSDRMSDAEGILKQGQSPAMSEFYHIDAGKVVASQNPWRSSEN